MQSSDNKINMLVTVVPNKWHHAHVFVITLIHDAFRSACKCDKGSYIQSNSGEKIVVCSFCQNFDVI